jgi:hypothetical protein
LGARLAIALRLFAGYCARRGIDHPEVAAYFDSLWHFLSMPGSTEAFDEWVRNRPPLVHVGLGDDYPPEFEKYLAARGVPDREFREAVECTTEVLYSSLYGAADEAGSRRFVGELAALAGKYGVPFPDTKPFSHFRWSDGHGWGKRPSAEEVAIWRYCGGTAE